MRKTNNQHAVATCESTSFLPPGAINNILNICFNRHCASEESSFLWRNCESAGLFVVMIENTASSCRDWKSSTWLFNAVQKKHVNMWIVKWFSGVLLNLKPEPIKNPLNFVAGPLNVTKRSFFRISLGRGRRSQVSICQEKYGTDSFLQNQLKGESWAKICTDLGTYQHVCSTIRQIFLFHMKAWRTFVQCLLLSSICFTPSV